MKLNLFSPKQKLAPLEECIDIARWVCGPAYNSLPNPIKANYNPPSTPAEREQKLTDFRRFVYEEKEKIPRLISLGYPPTSDFEIRLTAYHIFSNASFLAITKPVQSIPGFGPKYGASLNCVIIAMAGDGYTPGEAILNETQKLLQVWQEQLNKSPGVPVGEHKWVYPKKTPGRKNIEALRKWWLENGGSA